MKKDSMKERRSDAAILQILDMLPIIRDTLDQCQVYGPADRLRDLVSQACVLAASVEWAKNTTPAELWKAQTEGSFEPTDEIAKRYAAGERFIMVSAGVFWRYNDTIKSIPQLMLHGQDNRISKYKWLAYRDAKVALLHEPTGVAISGSDSKP